MVGNEAASDNRVGKIWYRHRIIINPQFFVNIQLFLLYLLFGSGHFPKGTQFEDTVVDVWTGENGAIRVLLDVLDLNITILLTTKLFLESELVVF